VQNKWYRRIPASRFRLQMFIICECEINSSPLPAMCSISLSEQEVLISEYTRIGRLKNIEERGVFALYIETRKFPVQRFIGRFQRCHVVRDCLSCERKYVLKVQFTQLVNLPLHGHSLRNRIRESGAAAWHWKATQRENIQLDTKGKKSAIPRFLCG